MKLIMVLALLFEASAYADIVCKGQSSGGPIEVTISAVSTTTANVTMTASTSAQAQIVCRSTQPFAAIIAGARIVYHGTVNCTPGGQGAFAFAYHSDTKLMDWPPSPTGSLDCH